MMSKDDDIQISFGGQCRIRVLDPEKFKHSETLEEECRGFVEEIREFDKACSDFSLNSVHRVVQVLQENAARID